LRPGERTIDLAPESLPGEGPSNPDWNRAVIFGRLEIPDDVVEAVFPPEERNAPPGKLYVVARCHETIYRSRVAEWSPPATPRPREVEIVLNWEDVRGTVELKPYLVRATESEVDPDTNYATTPHVRVASGDRYEVVVDHWDADEPSAIDGEEASFSRADHLPDGEKLYHLDFRNEARPKLWLNADYPRITDVLQSEGSVGTEPRFRDVVLDQISYAVWTQLIVRTATSIDRDGNVEHDWQRNVLQSFARELYNVDDVTDAAHMLREDTTDPDGLARLVQQIDHELQEYLDPRAQLINLMEEGLQL
jgi:hypothetical protein